MSIEKAMLARAKPYILTARARETVQREVCKGCLPDISFHPVALEPLYQPIFGPREFSDGANPAMRMLETPIAAGELVRLRLWISPDQKCDWNRCELFLKQLAGVRRRIAFEIIGNQQQIFLQILCHRDDQPVVQAAFAGQFEQCKLTTAILSLAFPPRDWSRVSFCDYYPPPPYSHLLTSPDELKRSPYAALITALAEIPSPALGFYQVVFAPVSPGHNWHQNVQALLDLEYSIKLLGGISDPLRYAQQAPSGDLRNMSTDVQTKAHNDKPFFAAAMRIGVIDDQEPNGSAARSLGVIASLFQHGGQRLEYLTEADYRQYLGVEDFGRMFTQATVHRSGFLLNSWELTSLVHVPSLEIIEHLKTKMSLLETLGSNENLFSGTPIGFSCCAGVNQPVCIPENMRTKHVHIIGGPGKGKSTTLEHMILHDIGRGQGVAVLDPHGTLIERLLRLMPPEHADRVIYINPADPQWVPIWNPLQCGEGVSRSRVADDLVRAFKSIVTGWGDRLEHLLRHAFFALLHLPGSSLLDVSNLLRQRSEQSLQIRRQLLKVIDNQVARLFWKEDFERYSNADLFPPQHKLSKLLSRETVSLMLSQSDSAFNLRRVMDEGGILLIDLSQTGPEILEILGCFMLSLLHITALGRKASAGESLLPFNIYCDEAHRFLTEALEDILVEARKFNVSLTLAHHYMSQFNTQQGDALSSVCSTIIFNIDTKDARHLKRNLQDKVEIEDLISQGIGQAIARIDNHVVRLETLEPLQIPQQHCREKIIEQSRRRYYRPVDEVKKEVALRCNQWPDSCTLDADISESVLGKFNDAELSYDAF